MVERARLSGREVWLPWLGPNERFKIIGVAGMDAQWLYLERVDSQRIAFRGESPRRELCIRRGAVVFA